MIKFISDKFLKTKKETHNTVIFRIDSENENIKVDFLFDNINENSSRQIGEFLYFLNNGYYIKNILDILSNLSSNNPEYATFINNILRFWSDKLPVEPSIEDKPIISPTHFQQNIFYKKT